MKKLLKYLTLCIILITAISFTTANAAVSLPYEDNFDSYKQKGSAPQGWTTWAKDNEIIQGVVNPDKQNENDYVMYLGVAGAGAPAVYLYFDESEIHQGKIEFQADLYVENLNLKREIFGLTTQENQDNNMITISEGKLNIRGASTVAIPEKKWFAIKVMYNTQNGELQVEYDGTVYKGSSYLRGGLTRVKFAHNGREGEIGGLYVNNVKITPLEPEKAIKNESADKSETLTPEKINEILNERLKNSIAVMIGSNKAIINGTEVNIDSDINVKPIIINGRTMVPLRFLSEALNCQVEWDAVKNAAVIANNIKRVTVPIDSNVIYINDRETVIDTKTVVMNGRTLIPLRAISNIFGKKIYWDGDSGLIVIGTTEEFFDLPAENKLSIELIKRLVFERPNIEVIKEMYRKKNPDNSHPRIYTTPEELEITMKNIEEDNNLKAWLEALKKKADEISARPVLTYGTKDDIGRIAAGWELRSRMFTLVSAYRLTGEEKYAKRALQDMEAAAAFEDWNPGHYLDCAEMTAGMAVGYDYLYDYMTEEQRSIMRKAIIEKGLNPGLEVYRGEVTGPWNRAAWATTTNNWNMVCNNGMILGAIAIAGEEDVAFEVLSYAIPSAEASLAAYVPDGAMDEGPMYWSYGTGAMVEYMAALESFCGSSFGLANFPGIIKTGYYPAYVTGPAGTFNYSDADFTNYLSAPTLFWFAKKSDDPDLAGLRYNLLNEHPEGISGLDLIWYNKDLCNPGVNLPLDKMFRKDEIALLRSAWNDKNAIYIGFHNGYNRANHGALDGGTFILDAMGERWAEELGRDNYNLSGYFDTGRGVNSARWTYYRNRAEGQNTIVLNPSNVADQNPEAVVPIIDFVSKPKGSYAVSDMTQAFINDVKSAKRGVMLFNNRTRALIQDEIVSAKMNTLWWFMHTKAQVRISEDGKSAILEKNGKKLKAIILSPSHAKFTVMDAKPLETSPNPAGQNPNSGFRKLAINLKNVREMTLTVYFVPLYSGRDDEVGELPQVMPIDRWSIEDGEIDLPVLTSITVNGQKLEDYNPNKKMYDFVLPEDTEDTAIPIVTAEGEGKIDISYPESLPGVIKVKVVDDAGVENNYYINTSIYVAPGSIRTPKGTEKLNIVSISASADDGNKPEYVNDRDLSTRWSAEGDGQWLQLELDNSYNIQYVAMAFYNGAARSTIFDIQISNDGNTWKTVYSGASSGATTEMELFAVNPGRAKYVRILGHGNTVNNWNSITEVSVYGSK